VEAALGAVVVALVIIAAVSTVLRALRPGPPRAIPATPRVRSGLMAVLAVVAAVIVLPGLIPTLRKGVFAFCGVCPIGTVAAGGPASLAEFTRNFFLATWYYTATVLPVFILASLFSGLLIARSSRFSVRGVIPSFLLAAVLPVCSCGVMPIGKTMIDKGGSSARDGLVFIATAPLLSPIIISMGFTLLGGHYLLVRVAASLVLALSVALLVRPLLRAAEGGGSNGASGSAAGGDQAGAACSGRSRLSAGTHGGSVLLAAWDMLTGLIRYVMFGLVLGSLFAVAVPPDYVGAILESGIASMATVVVVGVPINMCAGEEILLSAPLAGMGLTMGHAVAFALASTGICVSSIPLLVNVLGRRPALVMIGIYLVIPFLLGILINALPFLETLGPAPF